MTTTETDFSTDFDMDAFNKGWDDFHLAVKPFTDRIGFSSFKHYKRLSEETLCFDSNITLDGKKVGFARNDGHGGCTDITFTDNNLWKTVNEEIDRLWTGDKKHRLSFESLLSSLAAAFAEDKEWEAYVKRAVKRGGTAFRCAKAERPSQTFQFVMLNSRNPASVQKAHDEIISQGMVVIAQA